MMFDKQEAKEFLISRMPFLMGRVFEIVWDTDFNADRNEVIKRLEDALYYVRLMWPKEYLFRKYRDKIGCCYIMDCFIVFVCYHLDAKKRALLMYILQDHGDGIGGPLYKEISRLIEELKGIESK